MIALTSKIARQITYDTSQRSEVMRCVRYWAAKSLEPKTAAELSGQSYYLDSYAFNRRLPELELMGLVKSSGTRKEGRICEVKGTKCMTWSLVVKAVA